MTHRLNCWEIMDCGRGPSGSFVATFGACPAATDAAHEGVNHGHNAGRICWAIAGTLCDGRPHGTFAQKIDSCKKCDVYRRVRQEEGDDCVLSKRVGSIAQLKNEMTRLNRY